MKRAWSPYGSCIAWLRKFVDFLSIEREKEREED
jgi:hypothetical protein